MSILYCFGDENEAREDDIRIGRVENGEFKNDRIVYIGAGNARNTVNLYSGIHHASGSQGGVRTQAGTFFPRPGASQDLPSISEIGKMDGDPEHGKELFDGKGAVPYVIPSMGKEGTSVPLCPASA